MIYLCRVQCGSLEGLDDGAPGALDELLDPPPERRYGTAQRVGAGHQGAVAGHLSHLSHQEGSSRT